MKILVHIPWEEKPVLEKIVQDNYREPITQARNIVVKAGSDVLLTDEGTLDMTVMSNLIEQMTHYIKLDAEPKYQLTFVTSGAVAAGRDCLGEERAKKMSPRGLAMFGQSKLMEIYNILTRNYLGFEAGQVLVEEAHFSNKRRVGTKEAFDEAYGIGGLVIVNANDPVWRYELGQLKKGSDNDQNAVRVYNLLNADLLILLSSVDGLMYNIGKDDEQKIDLVLGVTKETLNLVKEINSKAGSWGMSSKLRRTDQVMDENGQVVIANGKIRDVIYHILNGENEGTYFAKEKRMQPYFL